MSLIEVGAAVETIRWRVLPDLYAGPSEYDDFAAATKYADECLGRVSLLLRFRNPDGVVLDEAEYWTSQHGDPYLEPGQRVTCRAWRLTQWPGGTAPLEYDGLDAALAAIPDGVDVEIFQVVWFGEIRCAGPQMPLAAVSG